MATTKKEAEDQAPEQSSEKADAPVERGKDRVQMVSRRADGKPDQTEGFEHLGAEK